MANLEHIRWRRLPEFAPRKTKRGFGNSPPLRPIAEHAKELKDDIDLSLEAQQAERADSGIDPAKLLVLSFDFATDQRAYLENLGLQIVRETVDAKALSTTNYSVGLRFESPGALNNYINNGLAQNIIRIERKRESSGLSSELKIDVVFALREEAKAFMEDSALASKYGFDLAMKEPVKHSTEVSYKLLVQFSDVQSLRVFQREFQKYGTWGGQIGVLTDIQRQELFDSLNSVSNLSKEDRLGGRLQKEGVPSTKNFYLDVDLWHPGKASLISEAIKQFQQLIESTGGSVTDAPYPIANSLLIARIKGTSKTLKALLNYDRVTRVDLPPILEAIEFAEWIGTTSTEVSGGVTQDGPLACIVDSGLVSGHPMLTGIVIDERDFDSGESTVVDRVGHGTYVAGIAAFGDTRECVKNKSWKPKVQLLSAKVMKLVPGHSGMASFAGFADEKRVENQLRDAITTFHKEYNCRIYNLSLGNGACLYGQGGQLPWAYCLDEIAKQLDVVIVVSVGNVVQPRIPLGSTEPEFHEAVKEQLFEDTHRLIDPACSVLALTVGSLSRTANSLYAQQHAGKREMLGSPPECPAPFTRTGVVDGTGDGLRRIVKPELVWYGGNYSLGSGRNRWNTNNPGLGEISLKHDFQTSRLLMAASGTSSSTPYVTHVAALVEENLRKNNPGKTVSGNLIRAMVVHSASVNEQLDQWLSSGITPVDKAEERVLRSVGYGLPNATKAVNSQGNRAVLYAEDSVKEDHFHLYELVIPQEFLDGKGTRTMKVTLAYDPPVSGTRKEYLSRTMWFEVYRGLTSEQIRTARSNSKNPLKIKEKVKFRPPLTTLQWSTVQSAQFSSNQKSVFEYRQTATDPVLWHILVGNMQRFDMGSSDDQNYALVVSLEHSNVLINIHQAVNQQNTARIRQHWDKR